MQKLHKPIIIAFCALFLSACAVGSLAGEPPVDGITWVLTTYNDAHPLDGALPTMEWFPLAGPLPEMAFEADDFIIRRVQKTKLEERLPVDPDFA